jgi:NAD(P)-dependent dehydrogenase (short-subunit alcohol dehydrogenase family)
VRRVELTDAAAVANAALELAMVGDLRFVIHVAGGAIPEELGAPDQVSVPLGAFRRAIEDNLVSAYVVVSAVAPMLRSHGQGGGVTLVSSTNAFGGYGAPGYSAAKAGLHGLAAALVNPLGRDKIRINVVVLGTTATSNYSRVNEAIGHATDFNAIARKIPLGRVLTPEIAAEALVSVTCDLRGMSGAVTVVDGGQSTRRP